MPPLRILLADDDANIGILLADILESLGHKIVAVATTEADTVAAALTLQPDMMILDARLRRGSGISAARQILQVRAIPYVLMSGAGIDGAGRGATILQKPFLQSELIDAIESACVSAKNLSL